MEDFVPTRASQIKKNAVNNYDSVIYQTAKKTILKHNSDDKKLLKKDPMKDNEFIDLRKQQEKEMKKARYDVIKFGMSGFEKVKARKAKVELAISLGAVPPKKRRINYKALKARRETEKESRDKHTSGFTNSMFKVKSKKTYKKNSSDILGIYGKVSQDFVAKSKR